MPPSRDYTVKKLLNTEEVGKAERAEKGAEKGRSDANADRPAATARTSRAARATAVVPVETASWAPIALTAAVRCAACGLPLLKSEPRARVLRSCERGCMPPPPAPEPFMIVSMTSREASVARRSERGRCGFDFRGQSVFPERTRSVHDLVSHKQCPCMHSLCK